MWVGVCFFFFKQKTAYEMRISDWSSDVCSSDLSCRCFRWRSPRDSAVCPPRCSCGLRQPIGAKLRHPRWPLLADVFLYLAEDHVEIVAAANIGLMRAVGFVDLVNRRHRQSRILYLFRAQNRCREQNGRAACRARWGYYGYTYVFSVSLKHN